MRGRRAEVLSATSFADEDHRPTTVADVCCAEVAPLAACPATSGVGALSFLAHFARSVEAKGGMDALRGTFHQVSSQSSDLAIELR